MATTPQSLRPAPGRPDWLCWSVFPLQSRFGDIDGMRIHYIDEGSGPALTNSRAGPDPSSR